MKFPRARTWIVLAVGLASLVGGVLWFNQRNAGVAIDRYKGVIIYDNGPLLFKSHGRRYSPTGYYWGQKWQCVEFVKRFYDVARGHQMPDVWGHAKDFFDPSVPQSAMNQRRGLRQFRNGGETPPKADDLFVFSGGYGHVGIVSEVGSNHVEIAQQNIYRKPRQRFEFSGANGTWHVQSPALLGWLRKD